MEGRTAAVATSHPADPRVDMRDAAAVECTAVDSAVVASQKAMLPAVFLAFAAADTPQNWVAVSGQFLS